MSMKDFQPPLPNGDHGNPAGSDFQTAAERRGLRQVDRCRADCNAGEYDIEGACADRGSSTRSWTEVTAPGFSSRWAAVLVSKGWGGTGGKCQKPQVTHLGGSPITDAIGAM